MTRAHVILGILSILCFGAAVAIPTCEPKRGLGGSGNKLRGGCGSLECGGWIEQCAQHRTLRDCRQDAQIMGCRP